MSDEEMTKYYNQLYKVDPSLAAEFAATGKLPDASVLEGFSNYTDKYVNFDDFIGDKYKTLGDFYKSQDGKMPSKARMDSFKKQHPYISEQEVTDWFNKTNKYRTEIEAERKAEAGRKRRAKEIEEEWGPVQKLLASEYSKQRYIEEPEASLYGKEGKEGKWWQRGEDISDVTFGAAGAVGDLIPGVGGAFVGPATRTLRDAYHVATNSPYQKDAGQIGRDFLADAGMNVGTAYLPTAILNRGAKLTRNISKTESLLRDAGEVRLANQSKQSVKEGVNQLKYDDIYNGISYVDLEKKIRDLPDGPMKQDLEALTRRGAPQSEISEHLVYWESVAPKEIKVKGQPKPVKVDIPSTAYYKGKEVSPYWSTTPVGGYVAEQAKAASRGKVAHILAGGAEGARMAGEPLVKEGYTYSGRGSEPKKVESKTERALKQEQKEWYKKNYFRDFEANFRPNKVEGDPLWEAYRDWHYIKFGKYPEDK